MKKRLLGLSLVSAFYMLSGCGSQTSEMVAPVVVQSPANATDQQASASSLLQPDRKITKIASDIFRDYDHNQNSTIDYRATATSYNDYYKTNESNTYGDIQYTGSVNNGPMGNYVRVLTRAKLFIASDKNNDGVLTTQELITFITDKFDLNHDGILSSRGIAFWQAKDEYNVFYNEYKDEFFKNLYV